MSPILIVGAGPVGLTMAAELARFGVSVRIGLTKAAERPHRFYARGSRAELLPTLNAFVTLDNNGLSGAANAVTGANGGSALISGIANPYFVGGAGNLLGQIFGRNFPDYAVGLNLNRLQQSSTRTPGPQTAQLMPQGLHRGGHSAFELRDVEF